MTGNRDALLRRLKKEASETPLTGWTSKRGEEAPRFKSPPDDEWIDRLIVEGHPLEEMGDWIRRAAERRIAKRSGNRPAGAVKLRNTLIRMLVNRFVNAGLKRGEVIREVAKAADLRPDTVRGILRETRF
ncbi:MAG: hypothetical protein OXE57_14855 [Alphaproteobacteria bacterium]|nr:hypothetical protein [Alphaproteobacteria bacterium]